MTLSFPLRCGREKVHEFINLQQDNMCVKEYALKFIQLSKYAQTMVADSRAIESKCVSGASHLVVKEILISSLLRRYMYPCLIVQEQRIEEEKLKEKTRESKRARKDNHKFSHSRSGGGNHSQGNSSYELMEHKFQSGGKKL